MDNKKGFTLIELLAVIAVLGLIGLLVYPAIEKTLRNARNDLYETQISSIVSGAKNWVADHPYDLPKDDGEELTISLCDLKIGSYVDSKLANPRTGKMFDCATKIKIRNVDNSYEYNVDFTDTVEEDVPSETYYPTVTLLNDYIEYVNLYGYYIDFGIKINDVPVFDDNEEYEVNITTNIINTDGINGLSGYAASPGNYVVKYEIIDRETKLKTVFYRTIIVKS